jgi:hypothetical protein
VLAPCAVLVALGLAVVALDRPTERHVNSAAITTNSNPTPTEILRRIGQQHTHGRRCRQGPRPSHR